MNIKKLKCWIGLHAWGLTHYHLYTSDELWTIAYSGSRLYPKRQPERRCAICNRQETLDVETAQNYQADTWTYKEG